MFMDRMPAILAKVVEELGTRTAAVIIGFMFGALGSWAFARWKMLQEKRSVLQGDARDTVVINLHIVETREVPATTNLPARKVAQSLRIRSLGQSELNRVVPNGYLEASLSHRVMNVSGHNGLISMEGVEGSYLLETLTNFVCDRVTNGNFEHDRYVLAPCCESSELAQHQPITLLLISVNDLALFENWPDCRDIQVEHGSDGARILTLMEMSRRFRKEQEELERRRLAGERTRFLETMYVLDLALDHRFASIPVKPVPWGRFESTLKDIGLE